MNSRCYVVALSLFFVLGSSSDSAFSSDVFLDQIRVKATAANGDALVLLDAAGNTTNGRWGIGYNNRVSLGLGGASGAGEFNVFSENLDEFPITVLPGSNTNAIFVDGLGHVGLGTITPGGPLGSKLSVSSSGSGVAPASVFLNNGVDEWSFGADPTIGAFIADGLRAYLAVGANGNVSISSGGTAADAKLHVGGTNDAKILVQNLGTATGTQTMLNLVNDGGVRFDMLDNSTGSNWVFQNQLGTFDVTLAGTGTREFRFYPNGNLEISGTYLQASSKSIKHGVEPVDQKSVLQKVFSLPINSWSYNREEGIRHMGPMSEDFYASFGLGATDKGITTVDVGGVVLAAIQGLKLEKDAEIEKLRHQLRQQEDRMLQLELIIAEILRNQSSEAQVGLVN